MVLAYVVPSSNCLINLFIFDRPLRVIVVQFGARPAHCCRLGSWYMAQQRVDDVESYSYIYCTSLILHYWYGYDVRLLCTDYMDPILRTTVGYV